jgi:hypothetical protein
MNMYGGVDVYIHDFLISALVGGEWSVSRLGFFTPLERASVHIGYEAGWTPESI